MQSAPYRIVKMLKRGLLTGAQLGHFFFFFPVAAALLLGRIWGEMGESSFGGDWSWTEPSSASLFTLSSSSKAAFSAIASSSFLASSASHKA